MQERLSDLIHSLVQSIENAPFKQYSLPIYSDPFGHLEALFNIIPMSVASIYQVTTLTYGWKSAACIMICPFKNWPKHHSC